MKLSALCRASLHISKIIRVSLDDFELLYCLTETVKSRLDTSNRESTESEGGTDVVNL